MTVITLPFRRRLHGFSGIIQNGNAWKSGSPLMDKMWAFIKAQKIPNKGLNHWYYSGTGTMFVGVELLEGGSAPGPGLEELWIEIPQYIYEKHVGPYDRLGGVDTIMREQLRTQGRRELSSLEIYGHAGPNTLPETELLIGFL